MEFRELPVSVQAIAAQTLSERILHPSVTGAVKEPAELAREISNSFIALYSLAQSSSTHLDNG